MLSLRSSLFLHLTLPESFSSDATRYGCSWFGRPVDYCARRPLGPWPLLLGMCQALSLRWLCAARSLHRRRAGLGDNPDGLSQVVKLITNGTIEECLRLVVNLPRWSTAAGCRVGIKIQCSEKTSNPYLTSGSRARLIRFFQQPSRLTMCVRS